MLQSIALLFPFLCSSFWAITLFLYWKQNPAPVRAGTIALFGMAISSLLRWASLADTYKEGGFYLLDILELFCTLGFFSCLILYFRTWTDKTPLNWKNYLVFLPGLLMAGALILIYFLIGEPKITVFLREVVHSYYKRANDMGFLYRLYDIIYFFSYKIVIILFANVVLVYAWICMIRYKAQQKPAISSSERKHHQAIFQFLFMAILFAAFVLIWDYLAYHGVYEPISICMFLWGCALFYLGYHLSSPDYAVESVTAEEETNTDDHTDEETWSKIKEKLTLTLDQLMKEMVFLQPDLRLEDLALKANTNRTYLARLLREEYNSGFPEYISRKRIEYACRLIQENPNLTLEQLAEKTGFLYASTFSRTFKQHTGINFREWKRIKN